MALAQQKKLIPIVWDMDSSNLLGWTSRLQALDLRGASVDEIRDCMSQIAETIKADKQKAWIVGGLLAAGLLCLLSRRQSPADFSHRGVM